MDDFDLGSEIHKLVSKLQGGDPAHLATARVKTAWNRAVPASIAKHVTGVFVVPETQAQTLPTQPEPTAPMHAEGTGFIGCMAAAAGALLACCLALIWFVRKKYVQNK